MLSMTARDTAHRLVAREQAAGGGTAVTVAVVEQALQRLCADLAGWFGPLGAHALLTRALAQARAEHPALAAVRVQAPRVGDPSPPFLEGLAESGRSHGEPAAAGAAMEVLASVVDLLGRLIGDTLAARMVEQGSRAGAPGRGSQASPGPGGATGTGSTERTTDAISDTTGSPKDD